MEKLTSPKPSELIRYVPKYTLIHYITYAETFFMRISITDLASLARSIFIINVPTYAYIKIRILYIYTGLRIWSGVFAWIRFSNFSGSGSGLSWEVGSGSGYPDYNVNKAREPRVMVPVPFVIMHSFSLKMKRENDYDIFRARAPRPFVISLGLHLRKFCTTNLYNISSLGLCFQFATF